jgi:hypothetical protein
MAVQTEVEFTLPKGFVDDVGTLHRHGVMRLATAADEILPLKEASVQKNPAYLTVILLSRVVSRLGQLELITPATIERMFAADVAYLQDLYNEINDGSGHTFGITCPHCDHHFDVERPSLGESSATPST